MLSLFYTLVCTFFVLPALLGPVKQKQSAAAQARRKSA